MAVVIYRMRLNMLLIKNIPELYDLVESFNDFEQQIISLSTNMGLFLQDFYADHVAIRCNQIETAERWRQGLTKCGTLLSEKVFNGRPVCLFKLNKPLAIAGLKIDCVEMPYPKLNGRYPQESWEHIELVVPAAEHEFHQKALSFISDEGLTMKGVKIKCVNAKKVAGQLPNPTVEITDGIVTIKFHPYSIQRVIRSELASEV